MSSDSDQTPQAGKRKKFLFPVSDDSDDSDYSIVQQPTRRKIFRVISEDESSNADPDSRVIDTSCESDLSATHRHSDSGESSDSSESQSDSSSSGEPESESPLPIKHKVVGRVKNKRRITSSPEIESDSSSDEQSEKCPICLLPFRKQQVGTPSSCDHCFCLECLIEWSKNINTCPVDRQTFTVIHVRNELGGSIINHFPVVVAPRVEDQVQEDPTFCEVCHHCDREDRMLLCDGCDCGYHLECLSPPMNEVPLEEWYCPECSQNSQNDAEAVEIDMDEISDLMEEARRLGVSYGRTRTGVPTENQPRIIPRTRHTERVRAIIRGRARICENPRLFRQRVFDPSQPSTSSGLDSFGDNSRSRSPSNASNSRRTKNSGSKGRGSRTTKRKSSKRSSATVVKEVRITEYNENGEQEEIVTYVKVAVGGKTRSGRTKRTARRKRKRTKYRRHARTVSSVLASGRKRLAQSLGICKPARDTKLLVPVLKSKSTGSDKSVLSSLRYSGISQVSLFGHGLGLDYSPPGSDAEEEYSAGGGSVVSVRRRTVIPSSRRRMNLKMISNPVSAEEPEAIDILGSIISSQETWHSKKNNVVLKANGLVMVNKKIDEGTNNDSPKKEKKEIAEEPISKVETPLEVSSVNPNDITQAPMYNNPCGGGNRGNFRGGYRDNGRHSHGGQNYSRDNLSGGGRHSYGGTGARENFGNRDAGPPGFYNPNFEHCGPPMFAGTPPFRSRNPQHFRNERFRLGPPERPQFNFTEGFDRNPFAERFARPRLPQFPGAMESTQNNFPPNVHLDTPRNVPSEQAERLNTQVDGDTSSSSLARQEDDCDIYCDIETTSKDVQEDQQNGSMALLPPPEPPSSLLDFDENSKSDKDSDQELVIDDSHKEDTPRADKYDPFAADSDSNDSDKVKRNNEEADIPIPLEPPPVPPFANVSAVTEPPLPAAVPPTPTCDNDSSVRLTAYDDDDDEDSQSDCPNFSIYSAQTMDVARHTEQELSQQIGPLEPPPLPPAIPDDDDIIVGDVQACDLADIPEPSDPYIESLQKERRALSKIPPKKISHDARGKITFKIGTKLKINNRLTSLQDNIGSSHASPKEEKPITEVKKNETTEEAVKKVEEEKKISSEKADEEDDVQIISDAEKEEPDVEIIQNTVEVHDKEEPKDNKVSERIENTPEEIKQIEDREDGLDKSSDTVLSVSDTLRLSPKKLDAELSIECTSEDGSEPCKSTWDSSKQDAEEKASKTDDDDDEEDEDDEECEDKHKHKSKSRDTDDGDSEKDSTEPHSLERLEDEEPEHFPIEKDQPDEGRITREAAENRSWESDGAYTPCKDELPIKEHKSSDDTLESGLEPITPTKDRTNDDLDGCRTPADYAGLGTEAISETDEAMNFEDELAILRKEKEMEDGEILEESKGSHKDPETSVSKDDDSKKKKKKEKKEKAKDTEKNKENISSENQVAWKKISKSTKERPYREKDKRSKSKEKEKSREREKDKEKDKSKKKTKEVVKKKEKRKELPRYDVRKIVAEKPPRPRKDEYGRDLRERSRSKSSSSRLSFPRERRSRSYSRARSRSRSRLRTCRSWSRDRRSYSRSYRSLSKRGSLSRSRRKSPKRRSVSRRRSTSKRHSVTRRRSGSWARKRRSLSPRRRSRRRSLSRSRNRRKTKTKKYKSRSRSRNRKRSRSKSPKTSSKTREKKHSKRKAQSRSRSRARSVSRDRNRNWDQMNEKILEREQHFSRERDRDVRDSWSAQWTPSWSRSVSRSKSPHRVQPERMTPREWSPPSVLDSVAVPPKNLTVILTNKEAIKKKKKERRKENRKSKEAEKKRKGKRNRTPPPSKEVFASGDNILVSVCFNKDNEAAQPELPELPETIPLMPPVKRRRREPLPVEPAKRSKKDKTKDKRSKSPKPKKDKKRKSRAAEIAATKKPVAVIDLDQSPFREQTPSPQDVIVLSDDDDKQAQEATTPAQRPPLQSSPPREQFVSQGPKTPPEPQIKFSIAKQTTNLRPSMINPLLEEEEEEEEEEMDERAEEELEMRAQEELELRLKIGPNTPPEPPTSPPTSPDAYDPFDPTKSRSPTPDASQEATPNDERERNRRGSPRKHDSADSDIMPEEPAQQQEMQSQEKQSDKPKIISMVTIKRASPPRDASSPTNEPDVDTATSTSSPPKSQQSQQNVQSLSNPFSTINPVLATVAAAVQRSGVFNAATPNSVQRNLIQTNRISPSSQSKQQQQQQQQQQGFTNTGKLSRLAKSSQNKSQAAVGQNGNDTGLEATENVDMSSPYSPGSTLSDGMFDPPSPPNFTGSPGGGGQPTKNNTSKPIKSSTDKKDAFDALFNAAPTSKPATKSGRTKKEKRKKSTNPKVGVRMDENQLQILDDLPSSAVEMQVKDKFLKKLNRQERVVEEVKLVLKPHYTKKHVTKEEYKDIMRKAVPKICHNKTGEINPKKIAHLIEAYVRRCRNSKKKTVESTKVSKSAKTLWS